MINWLPNIAFAELIVGALIGGLIGLFLTHYVQRPKLVHTGGGTGGTGNPRQRCNHLRFLNDPGFLGVRLGYTTILGRVLFEHFERGLVFDRYTAHECRASLYDKRTGQHLNQLWWGPPDAGDGFVPVVTLKSGDSVNLRLFARLDNEPTKYFVYQPENDQGPGSRVPPEDLKYTGSRDFEIRISYFYGRKTVKVPVKVTTGLPQGPLCKIGSQNGGHF